MKKVALFFFLMIGLFVDAQQITFNKQFMVWTEKAHNNFQQTADSGYVICTDAVYEMDTLSPSPLSYCYLIKTDKNGDVVWQKSFPKSNYATKGMDGNSVFQTSDLGYIVTTGFYEDGAGVKILVIKTDLNGNLEWSGMYPGLGISLPNCVKQCSDSGFIIAGNTVNLISAKTYGYLLKLNNTGAIEWSKTFADTAGYVDFKTVLEISGSGYIAVGYSLEGAVVVTTDLNGNDLWKNTYLSSNSFFNSIAKADGTNFICAGVSYDPASTTGIYQQPLLMKIDALGNIIWTKTANIDGQINDIKSVEGSQLIASADFSNTVLSNCASLIKLDFSGNVLWSKGYINATMAFSCVDGTMDNAYALYTAYFAGSTFNAWRVGFVKTDADGNINCSETDLPITFSNISTGFVSNLPSAPASVILPKTVTLLNSDLQKNTICEYYPEYVPVEDDCLFIPNVFSPNKDNTNDFFNVGYCGNELCILKIYNRWGELQFETNDLDKYWNGENLVGLSAVEGTYYYILNIGTKTHKGFLTLVR